MSNHSEPSDQLPPSTGSVHLTASNVFTLTIHISVFLIGIPGNCLILHVYWPRVRRATSTTVLILALAWADLVTCLLRLRRILQEMFVIRGLPVHRVFKVMWGFGIVPPAFSVLVTAIIAVDRYDCVCRPHSRWLSPRRAKMALAVSFLVALTVAFPAILTEARGDSSVTARLIIFAFQTLFFIMALVLIVVCYSLVYRAIRRHVRVGIGSNNGIGLRHRKNSKTQDDTQSSACTTQLAASQGGVPPSTSEEGPSTAEQQRPRQAGGGQQSQAQRGRAPSLQRKTTRMLFITSVVFLLTWLPYWVYIGMEMARYSGWDVNPNLLDGLGRVSASLYINNVVNPFIYGLANRRFRKDCFEALRKLTSC